MRAVPWIAGFLCVSYLVAGMEVENRNIGFNHDELWDFIPAVGLIHGDSISPAQEVRVLGHPVPLVTGPYQGAMKTWLSAPLIAIMGTSTRTLRAINTAYTIIFLLTLYWAVLPVIGTKWSWVVFVFPYLDTNFLITAPMDYGPTLFQCIFIALAIGSLFRCMTGFRWLWYWQTFFFSGCILSQKLTSIPVVSAVLIVLVLGSLRQLWLSTKLKGLKSLLIYGVAAPSFLFLLPLAPHLIYFGKTGMAPLFSVTAAVAEPDYLTKLKRGMLFLLDLPSGGDWYQRITLYSLPSASIPFLPIAALITTAASVTVSMCSHQMRTVFTRYSVTALGVGFTSLFLYPAFKGLTRPWHYYIVAPLMFVCCLTCSAQCISYVYNRIGKGKGAIRTLAITVSALVIACGVTHGISVMRQIDVHGGACLSSPAIEEWYRTIKENRIEKLYAINYSIAYPIYVLSGGTISVEDLSWTQLSEAEIRELFGQIREHREAGIAYRYCGCREGDAEWIKSLNRLPELDVFRGHMERERSTLKVQSLKDNRGTEFFLLTKGGLEAKTK